MGKKIKVARMEGASEKLETASRGGERGEIRQKT